MIEGLEQVGVDAKEACENLILSKSEAVKRFAILYADAAGVGALDSSPEVRRLAQKILEKESKDES